MFKISLSLIAGLMIGTSATAATLSIEETLGAFGLVTQSFTGNSESEGRIVVQGDVTGNVSVNDRTIGDNGDGYDDLIITGNVTGARVTVGQSGNLTVGGNITNTTLQLNGGVQTATLGGTRTGGNFNQNEDILIENATDLRILDISFGAYEAESVALSTLTGASVSTNASGQTVFGGSAVIATSFADLGSGTGVFDLSGIDTLLINVAGTSGSVMKNFVDFNSLRPIEAAPKVVWNFFEATELSFNTTVFGQIIAPNTQLSLNSSNEGNVIARSVIANNGELHPVAFTGTLPGTSTPVSPVPLPAGLPMLLSALGLGWVLRKRARA